MLVLTIHITEIRTIVTTLFETREKRRKSKSSEPKVDSKQVRVNVCEAITDLIHAIELARKAHLEVDYTTMIVEINQLFSTYQSEIKAHSARIKNANSKKNKPARTNSVVVFILSMPCILVCRAFFIHLKNRVL
ncbi:MAG: hypothetical protein WCK78_03435 [Paludibacter sp.]